jgi:MscS family membrane protein
MSIHKSSIFMLFLLFNFSGILSSHAASADKKPADPPPKKTAIIFRDNLKRDTPRGTTKGLLAAAKDKNYKKLANFFDLSYMPYDWSDKDSANLSRQLKVVLDQKLWIDVDNINNTSAGNLKDNLPENQEIIGVIKSDESNYNIILQQSTNDKNDPIWLISAQTVHEIPKMYEEFGHGVLGEIMPAFLLEKTIFEITVGEWISLIAIILLGLLISIILSRLIIFILKLTKSNRVLHCFNTLLWPIRLLFIVILGRTTFELLVYSVKVKSIMEASTIMIIIAIWFFFKLIDYLFDVWSNSKNNQEHQGVIVLYSLFTKVLKLLILFIGATIWLDNLGFKVTTIIASLGVGGIALALAAQKTIEDVIGAMTLLSARPVEIGDFIKVGDNVGTVEQISLRLTKIRTMERTLVNIPNSKFASLELENLSKRDKRQFNPSINLPYETTSEQLHTILEGIRKVLDDHPKVLPEPLRVRFAKLGTYALHCETLSYIDTTDHAEYLAIAEELNFSIINVIEQAGSRLAIPAQTIYKPTNKPNC